MKIQKITVRNLTDSDFNFYTEPDKIVFQAAKNQTYLVYYRPDGTIEINISKKDDLLKSN